ncbi:hypothetical protein [Alkaliphilus crotonatoxidans]
MSRIYPDIIVAALLRVIMYVPVLIALYFVIYFAVLAALRKHEKTKSN